MILPLLAAAAKRALPGMERTPANNLHQELRATSLYLARLPLFKPHGSPNRKASK